MEYEKAYKDALEDMRVIYPNLKGDAKLAVEHAFPELAESEDERIRRELVAFFIEVQNREGKEGYWHDLEVGHILAYLEKQKDCFFVPKSHLDPVGEPGVDGMEILEKQKEQNKCPEFCSGHCVGCERNEQKPVEVKDPFSNANFVRGYESGYADAKREQKPVEWSEEDEKIRKALVWHIKADVDFISNGVTKAECLAYLDKQKAQKQEWNEEDERVVKSIINYLSYDGTQAILTEEIDEWIVWLKSLRPDIFQNGNSHWKPSEEQLNALNFAITYFMHETNYKNPTGLRDLYDDLLKLK